MGPQQSGKDKANAVTPTAQTSTRFLSTDRHSEPQPTWSDSLHTCFPFDSCNGQSSNSFTPAPTLYHFFSPEKSNKLHQSLAAKIIPIFQNPSLPKIPVPVPNWMGLCSEISMVSYLYFSHSAFQVQPSTVVISFTLHQSTGSPRKGLSY